jgi:hypothetical protein
VSHCGFTTACVIAILAAASPAHAQVLLPIRPYDGIQAGLDAFRLAEEKRQATVAGQLALNQQLFFWPAPSYGASVIYSPFGFYLPAYSYPTRQPIGQQQAQTGPNRWESHPVYDPPLTPYLPLPPVDSPWLDRTIYAPPRYFLVPPPKPSSRRLIDEVEEAVPPPPPEPISPQNSPPESRRPAVER